MLFVKSHMDFGGRKFQVLCAHSFAHPLPIDHPVIYFTGSQRTVWEEKDFDLWILYIIQLYILGVFMSSGFSILWNGDMSKVVLLDDNAALKVYKLSFQRPLPTLTDPTTGANLTSHITIEQAEPEYYLTVLKFSLLLLSAFLSLLRVFLCIIFSEGRKFGEVYKLKFQNLIISQSSNIGSEKYSPHNNQLIFSSQEN